MAVVTKRRSLGSSSPFLTLGGPCPLPTQSLKKPLITKADSKGLETGKLFLNSSNRL